MFASVPVASLGLRFLIKETRSTWSFDKLANTYHRMRILFCRVSRNKQGGYLLCYNVTRKEVRKREILDAASALKVSLVRIFNIMKGREFWSLIAFRRVLFLRQTGLTTDDYITE